MTQQRPDLLQILSSTRFVVEQSEQARIIPEAVERLAAAWYEGSVRPPEWDERLHWRGGPDETANYILALDTANFSFWGEPRWRVTYHGQVLDGYWALAASLKRAIEEGRPVWDAHWLANLTRPELETVFRGEGEVPMLDERLTALRATGRLLLERYGGLFTNAIAQAQHNAPRLARLLADQLPSFDDVAEYQGQCIRFYKRAQICAADLYGAFGGQGPGRLDDLDQLTAFADYKLPQVLRRLGVLWYREDLHERICRRELIPAGSPAEVEIRANTIWAVEELRRALARDGVELAAVQIDWYLWELGQRIGQNGEPYHRTRTIFY